MTREDIRVLTDDEIECFNDCSYDIFITTVSRVFDYFENELKELRQYKDSTVGMFATDRPDLVDDSLHRVLFELGDWTSHEPV